MERRVIRTIHNFSVCQALVYVDIFFLQNVKIVKLISSSFYSKVSRSRKKTKKTCRFLHPHILERVAKRVVYFGQSDLQNDPRRLTYDVEVLLEFQGH